MEVGDKFKFKKTSLNKYCYYLEKVFKIELFSKSKNVIYYKFKVSKNRCQCLQCKERKIGFNNINVSDVYIHQSKKDIERIKKINLLLN